MPHRVPELKGEPLTFGISQSLPAEVQRLVKSDTEQGVIKEAIDVTDLCSDIHPNEKLLVVFRDATEAHDQAIGLVLVRKSDAQALKVEWRTCTTLDELPMPTDSIYGIPPQLFMETINDFWPW